MRMTRAIATRTTTSEAKETINHEHLALSPGLRAMETRTSGFGMF